MKCMTYLLTKDGKQSDNERQASYKKYTRPSDASFRHHDAIPLE